MISAAKREDIIGALRRGTVPGSGLDAFAVGVDAFAPVIDEELERVAAGRGAFKAVRGEYGSGKTFFGRWFQERARSRGFAASEVRSTKPRPRCTSWRPSIDGWWSALARQTPRTAHSAA